MNGVVVSGGKPVLFLWLTDRHTWKFFSAIIAAFLIIYGFVLPKSILPPETWQIAALAWVAVLGFFVILIGLILGAFYVSRLTQTLVLPITLVVFAAHTINQLLALTLSVQNLGVTESVSTIVVWRVLFLYVFVVISEAIFTVYVLPGSCLYKYRAGQTSRDGVTDAQPVLTETSQAAKLPAAANELIPKFVAFGGKQFELAKIKMISAEDNYVSVQMASETVLVRASMKEVVDALPKSVGVRAHRSHWVNFRHVDSCATLKNGKMLLNLASGDTVTVPRARRHTVSKALDNLQVAPSAE